jgi:hypothetical protein
LLVFGAVLTTSVVLVTAARDAVIVPALHDASRRLGYAATDDVWTLSVTAMTALACLLALLCLVAAVRRLWRAGR